MTKERPLFAMLQKTGKSLMLPVSVLPVAGLLLGIGSAHFTWLPPALSGHLAYHSWGPPAQDPAVLIVLDDDRETLERLYESVELAGHVSHPYSMPYQHFDVWVCRRPRVSLRAIWPSLRKLG